MRLAERMGLDRADIEASYYLALLAWVGCTADSHETAALFGDDVELRAGVYDVEIGSPAMLGYLLRRAGSDRGPLHRARVATPSCWPLAGGLFDIRWSRTVRSPGNWRCGSG